MDEELVNRIVKEVLLALGQASGGRGAAAASSAPAFAPCATGSGAAPARPATAARAVSKAAAVSPGPRAATRSTGAGGPWGAKVFLTADMLRQRIAGASDKRTLELAWNEALTPNADDLAQQLHLAVRRKQRPAAGPASTVSPACAGEPAKAQGSPARGQVDARPPAGAGAPGRRAVSPESVPLGLLLDRADDKVASLVAGLTREGLRLTDFTRTGCVLGDLESLCEAIRSGQVRRGIVVAPYAASLLAVAAKHKGVRPVQGTRPSSVEAGLRQYGANLLVVEHAFSTFHEIRAMVRAFAAGPGGPPTDPALAEALDRLDGR